MGPCEWIDPDRTEGLRIWEEWLEARLSPYGIVRADPNEFEGDEAVWRIGFRDDTRARIHVMDQALRLTGKKFEVLTDELEDLNWLSLLKATRPGGIRIHADGGIDELDPEGAKPD